MECGFDHWKHHLLICTMGKQNWRKFPLCCTEGDSDLTGYKKQRWQPPFQKECCKSSKPPLGPHKGTVTFGVTATEPTDGLMVKSTLQSYLQAAYPKFIPLNTCLVRSLEIFLSGSFSIGQPKTKHLETSLYVSHAYLICTNWDPFLYPHINRKWKEEGKIGKEG